jgi:hypothetical protein
MKATDQCLHIQNTAIKGVSRIPEFMKKAYGLNPLQR